MLANDALRRELLLVPQHAAATNNESLYWQSARYKELEAALRKPDDPPNTIIMHLYGRYYWNWRCFYH